MHLYSTSYLRKALVFYIAILLLSTLFGYTLKKGEPKLPKVKCIKDRIQSDADKYSTLICETIELEVSEYLNCLSFTNEVLPQILHDERRCE